MTYEAVHNLEDDTLTIAYDSELTGDPTELLRSLGETRQAIQTLKNWEAELVERLGARVQPGERLTVDGTLWRAKRKQGNVTWDHDSLTRRMLAVGRDQRKVDEATGEVESAEEAVLRVTVDCAGLSYWRLGRLEHYGIDGTEHRSTDLGPVQFEVIEP